MNNKDLKRLSRRELVDIIYRMKQNEEKMQEQILDLENELRDKRIRITVAGSIAAAAADITDLFATAQKTADLYLSEIALMKEETEKACAEKLRAAGIDADALLSEIKEMKPKERRTEPTSNYKTEYEKWIQLQAEFNGGASTADNPD